MYPSGMWMKDTCPLDRVHLCSTVANHSVLDSGLGGGGVG